MGREVEFLVAVFFEENGCGDVGKIFDHEAHLSDGLDTVEAEVYVGRMYLDFRPNKVRKHIKMKDLPILHTNNIRSLLVFSWFR